MAKITEGVEIVRGRLESRAGLWALIFLTLWCRDDILLGREQRGRLSENSRITRGPLYPPDLPADGGRGVYKITINTIS